MYHAIPYTFEKENIIYIDVRSESEYKTGHIPGAINMPILYDIERHEVGWLYKNASVEEAKRVGLKYGSDKLHHFYDTLFRLRNEHPHSKIIFYCARGGYRSRSIALLLRSIDIPVFWLQGGYKNYRAEVLKKINQPEDAFPHFIVLNGHTGVGKTRVLQALRALGEPVLDLEEAANHKGSNLGAIGTNGHQSVQRFENHIYDQLMRLEASYCFVESESRKIGQVYVPKTLFAKMQQGDFILLEADVSFRIKGLMADYAGSENFDEGIIAGMARIKQYMSSELYDTLYGAYKSGNLEAFTEGLLTHYYDPLYEKSIGTHQHVEKFTVSDYSRCAISLKNWVLNSFPLQSEEPAL